MRKSSEPDRRFAEDAEAKAAFHLRLRARGVRDLAVLRAFEIVPRARFVSERHAALAARDLPLPIPCGQTSHEPWILARAVEALGIEPGQRVLEIGSGSGYVTAILAHLAGAVLGLERYASLAAAAQARLEALELANAAVVWGDGFAVPPEAGGFERVLVHGAFEEMPACVVACLASSGRVVGVRADGRELVCWHGAGADPVPSAPAGSHPSSRGAPRRSDRRLVRDLLGPAQAGDRRLAQLTGGAPWHL